MWQAFIAQLIAAFGPKLAQLVMDWINSLFKKTAEEYGGSPPDASDQKATRHFLEACLKNVPRVRPFRKAIVRNLIDNLPAAVAAGTKLPKDAADECVTYAGHDPKEKAAAKKPAKSPAKPGKRKR